MPATMSPSPIPASSEQRMRAQRSTGLAMLGSALALVTLAALTAVGVVPMSGDIRGWATAGIGLAGVLDGFIGVYFLRASSKS